MDLEAHVHALAELLDGAVDRRHLAADPRGGVGRLELEVGRVRLEPGDQARRLLAGALLERVEARQRDAELLLERVDRVLEREGARGHDLLAALGLHVVGVGAAGALLVHEAVQVVRRLLGIGQRRLELRQLEGLDEGLALAVLRDLLAAELRVDEDVDRDLGEVRVRVVVLHDVQRLTGVAQAAVVVLGLAARGLLEAVAEVLDELGPAGLHVDRDARLVDLERVDLLVGVGELVLALLQPRLHGVELRLVALVDLGVGLVGIAGVGRGVLVALGTVHRRVLEILGAGALLVDVAAGEAARVVDVLDRVVAAELLDAGLTRALARGAGALGVAADRVAEVQRVHQVHRREHDGPALLAELLAHGRDEQLVHVSVPVARVDHLGVVTAEPDLLGLLPGLVFVDDVGLLLGGGAEATDHERRRRHAVRATGQRRVGALVGVDLERVGRVGRGADLDLAVDAAGALTAGLRDVGELVHHHVLALRARRVERARLAEHVPAVREGLEALRLGHRRRLAVGVDADRAHVGAVRGRRARGDVTGQR